MSLPAGTLLTYADARCPIVCVNHNDPHIVDDALLQAVKEGVKIEVFDNALGWLNSASASENNKDLAFFLENARLNAFDRQLFLVLLDCGERMREAAVIALLKRISQDNRALIGFNAMVVSVCANFAPPEQLKEFITIIDIGLPGENEIKRLIGAFCETNEITVSQSLSEKFTEYLTGLSEFRIEQILNLCYANGGCLCEGDLATVAEEKKHIIRMNGVLRNAEPLCDFNAIGGYEPIVERLKSKAALFLNLSQAKESGVDFPVTALFKGGRGRGKHTLAKAFANCAKLPLLELSRAAPETFGCEKIIEQARISAPCVLLIDIPLNLKNPSELREILNGVMLNNSPVFICLVLNGNKAGLPLSALPDVDDVFFLGAPSEAERAQIFTVHLKKRGKLNDGTNVFKAAAETDGFGGREIEIVVKQAARAAFCDNRREIETFDLINAANVLKSSIRPPFVL